VTQIMRCVSRHIIERVALLPKQNYLTYTVIYVRHCSILTLFLYKIGVFSLLLV